MSSARLAVAVIGSAPGDMSRSSSSPSAILFLSCTPLFSHSIFPMYHFILFQPSHTLKASLMWCLTWSGSSMIRPSGSSITLSGPPIIVLFRSHCKNFLHSPFLYASSLCFAHSPIFVRISLRLLPCRHFLTDLAVAATSSAQIAHNVLSAASSGGSDRFQFV